LETIFDVVWASNSWIGRFLVVVICTLAIYAGRCARKHISRYQLFETAQLANVERTLKETQAKPIEAKETHASEAKAPGIVSIDSLRESVVPQSIIGDRLSVLAQLRASQVKVSFAALQEVSLARESSQASLRFPGFAVGLLMLIGLLGTFIGIAMIVQNIGITDTTSLDAVRTQINGALEGMRTKFSTTLVGLFCAIVVSLLNFRLAQAQAVFFQRLDRFTSTQLLPATIPAVEDETILEKITLQLESSFSRLNDLAKQNVETVAEVSAIQTGFAGIVDSLQKSKRTESPERLQMIIGQLSGVMEQVVSMNESVRSVLTTLPSLVAGTNDSMRRLLDALPDLIQRNREQINETVLSPFDVRFWPKPTKIFVGILVSVGVVVALVMTFR
jgi:biopolymer transport protein ExbB/TolQ